MSALENRLPPPLVFLVVGLIMGVTAYYLPYEPLISREVRIGVGAALFILAGAFGPFAILAFGRANTTIDPVNIERASTLVTSGAFRFTRNPMYLSMALLLTALAAVLATPWAILGPIVFAAFITRFQIVPEERLLTSKFGADYAAYRQRVRRWI